MVTQRQPPQQKTSLIPLENGDSAPRFSPLGYRLSRHEFERRYEAMPQIKKAELIEGVVYVAAALRFRCT